LDWYRYTVYYLKAGQAISARLAIASFESIRSHPLFRVSPKPHVVQNTWTTRAESAKCHERRC